MLVKVISTLAVFVTVMGISAKPADTTNVEDQIRQMEITRLAFPKDSARWADDIADDALFMQGTGVVISKQQTIENYKNSIEAENSTDLKKIEFRQSGDTAIFSYVSTRIRHDDADHAMRHQHVNRTVVYQRRTDKWKLVLLSAAILPWADAKQRPVDPSTLDEYVGTYADFPPPNTVTFTREGSRLMAQESNEKEKTEMLALSDDTFAVPGELNQIYFERGPDGHFLHLWYRDLGGDQILQPRIGK